MQFFIWEMGGGGYIRVGELGVVYKVKYVRTGTHESYDRVRECNKGSARCLIALGREI